MLRKLFGSLGGLALLLVGLQLASACDDVADTSYGNPTGLQVSNLPGEAGTLASTACVTKGLKFDSGSCPSFANDIFPYMKDAWGCTGAGCHGGNTPPKLNPNDPAASLASLKATSINGKPYLSGAGDAGSTSATILCNLQGQCGFAMPKLPFKVSTADVCLLQLWIQCGTPP